VAHRGNSSQYLENSIRSLQSALDLRTPAIEFDIHHTRDGKAIIMHDSTLKRTAKSKPGKKCDLHKKIRDLSIAQIRNNCQLQNGEAVPTLEDVIALFRNTDTQLFFEFKDIPNTRTLDLIFRAYLTRPKSLRVISFKTKALDRARESHIGQLIARGAGLFHISSKAQNVSFDYDGICVKKPTEAFVEFAYEAKKPINVWTINDRDEMIHYSDLGVDYITTNFPKICIKLIGDN